VWAAGSTDNRNEDDGKTEDVFIPSNSAVISLIHLLCPGETEQENGGPGADRVELAASHPRIGKQALHLPIETDCRGFPSIMVSHCLNPAEIEAKITSISNKSCNQKSLTNNHINLEWTAIIILTFHSPFRTHRHHPFKTKSKGGMSLCNFMHSSHVPQLKNLN